MQALRRAWVLALAGVVVGGGVAAATVQGTVQPAVHGTVHAVAGTGFLLGYACPPGGKCVAVGGTGSLGGQNIGRGVVVPVVRGLPGRGHEAEEGVSDQLDRLSSVELLPCGRRGRG